MRVIIAAIGRLKAGAERTLLEHYCKRIEAAGRSASLTPFSLIELPESRARDRAQRVADEAERLMRSVPAGARVIALDERGKSLRSTELAALMGRHRDQGVPAIAFLIGGPDGHGAAVGEGAHLSLSLSALTLPHGLARIVLSEQIYRVATILSGHPYHRD